MYIGYNSHSCPVPPATMEEAPCGEKNFLRGHPVHPTLSPSFLLTTYSTPGHLRASARSHARSYLQSFPKVLLSSALWRCGYWSANFLRAACAHTMKAFMGLLTWGLLLLLPLTRTGMGTRVQS